METPSMKTKMVSIYNCPACGETIYKLARKGGRFRSCCPHCGVRLSTNLLGFAVCFLGATLLQGTGLIYMFRPKWGKLFGPVGGVVFGVVGLYLYWRIMTKGPFYRIIANKTREPSGNQ